MLILGARKQTPESASCHVDPTWSEEDISLDFSAAQDALHALEHSNTSIPSYTGTEIRDHNGLLADVRTAANSSTCKLWKTKHMYLQVCDLEVPPSFDCEYLKQTLDYQCPFHLECHALYLLISTVERQ